MKISDIRECFWPLLEPLNPNPIIQINENDIQLTKEENIKMAYDLAIKYYENEEKRGSSVEGKSTIFIGTVGFLITILLTITKDLPSAFGLQVLVSVIALGLIIIYLCRVVWFAIKALQVGKYHALGCNVFICGDIDYQKRLIISLINCTKRNAEVINLKVDYMTMAQEYFKRAICSIGCYAIILILLSFYKQKDMMLNNVSLRNIIFSMIAIFIIFVLKYLLYLKIKNLVVKVKLILDKNFIRRIIPVLLPCGKLLSAIFFVWLVWFGVLCTMPQMDSVVRFMINENLSSYEQAVKWGERYIFFFPLIVYTLIFSLMKKDIFKDVDYYKKVLDCITGLGVLLLFGNQYWKIDEFKMFFSNEYFGGISIASLWFRMLIISSELLKSKTP